MVKIAVCIIFFSLRGYSQTYLNIHYTNASLRSSEIISLQKIFFTASGTKMNYVLTNGTTVIDNCDVIQRISFGPNIPGVSTSLPVELVSFTALKENNYITLKWSTATECNNYGFEVERIHAGMPQWTKIGFVAGNGTSNAMHTYAYTDHAISSNCYAYRLKQIDNSGGYKYSECVDVAGTLPTKLALEQNYPNPFNPVTKISYTIPSDAFVAMKVYDVMGREVALLVSDNIKAGRYTAVFDGNRFASGVYYCMIRSGSSSASVKMILIK